ncbi:type IV pilus twitching motility protein PilT [Acidobacteriota bacterium]
MDQTTFNKLLAMGVRKGVSDIHLQVGYPPLFRYNGNLVEVKFQELMPSDTEELARFLLEARGISLEEKTNEEFDISYGIEGTGRFRVNIFLQRETYAVVLRVLPHEIRNFAELNLPTVLEQISNIRRGLILVTGATGMGKSTTLAAIIDQINRTRRSHIITIEDPIEFLFKHEKSVISQREIGNDTLDYKTALRAAMRQDPDVIMVGELRDNVTMDICLKAAETGHLVMSSVHTTDVPKTIGRVISFFPPEEQSMVRLRLSENLMGVASLRLLINKAGTGRVPAVEIMRVTRSIQECIKHPDRIHEIKDHIEKGKSEYGMQTFDQHLVDLFKKGMISQDVARFAASSPSEFERALTLE